MIAALKKAWIKWCIACAMERQERLEYLYVYECEVNKSDIAKLYTRLEMVEAESRRNSIVCGPL